MIPSTLGMEAARKAILSGLVLVIYREALGASATTIPIGAGMTQALLLLPTDQLPQLLQSLTTTPQILSLSTVIYSMT